MTEIKFYNQLARSRGTKDKKIWIRNRDMNKKDGFRPSAKDLD